MKAIATTLLFAIAGLTTQARAQTNLNTLRERCNNESAVKKTVFIDQSSHIETMTISNNQGLVEEFYTAFGKDKANAYETSFTVQEGKTIPTFVKFKTAKGTIAYYFKFTDTSNAKITFIAEPRDAAEDFIRTSDATPNLEFIIEKNAAITSNGGRLTVAQAKMEGYAVELADHETIFRQGTLN